MDREPYIRGKQYEVFMSRVYPNQKTKRNGVDSLKMAYLIETENGHKFYGQPSRQKQLVNIKAYLIKAITKLKSLDWTIEEFGDLLDQEDKVENAIHSSELLYAISELMELTEKFQIENVKHNA